MKIVKNIFFGINVGFWLILLFPFYLIGATFGQIIGSMYQGYKKGLEIIVDWNQKISRWRISK